MAYKNLVKHVSPEKRSDFNKMKQTFIDASNETPMQTPNKNALPSHLFSLYQTGQLDGEVIEILTTRVVLRSWKGTNPAHIRLLLPMCHILLEEDLRQETTDTHYSTVTFNNEKYDPFVCVSFEDLPFSVKFDTYDETARTCRNHIFFTKIDISKRVVIRI